MWGIFFYLFFFLFIFLFFLFVLCNDVLSVLSCFVIILPRKKALVALL